MRASSPALPVEHGHSPLPRPYSLRGPSVTDRLSAPIFSAANTAGQRCQPREMAAGFSTTPKGLCRVTTPGTDLEFGYFSRFPGKQVVCKTQQDLDAVLVQPAGRGFEKPYPTSHPAKRPPLLRQRQGIRTKLGAPEDGAQNQTHGCKATESRWPRTPGIFSPAASLWPRED